MKRTLGIIGGGQLGRMSAMAAYNLGFNVAILTDSPDSPAAQVCPSVTIASCNDSMINFARAVDFITYEFENVDHMALLLLENMGYIVRPSSYILSVSQDRLIEKEFFRSINLSVANFVVVNSGNDIYSGIEKLGGFPVILKKRTMGYDGKGQHFLRDMSDVDSIINMDVQNCILEQYVPFTKEMSIIVARGISGDMVTLPVAHNIHENGILKTSVVPSGLSCDFLIENIAKKIACSLGLVGILAIEMFHSKDFGIIINEMAPRPHNSGHWSEDSCNISQFALHVRAATGLPLIEPRLLRGCTMRNLIGDDISLIDEFLKNDSAKIYLYGKDQVCDGRKMGHVNIIGEEYGNN